MSHRVGSPAQAALARQVTGCRGVARPWGALLLRATHVDRRPFHHGAPSVCLSVCLSCRRTCMNWARARFLTDWPDTRTPSLAWPSARRPPRYGLLVWAGRVYS